MCEGTDFKLVINFGENPLVNSLIEKEDLDKQEPTFPLVVRQCQNCHLVQVTDIVDSHEIYKNVDYLYFSGDMPNLKEYFAQFAGEIKKYMGEDDLIVEIGSNDGIFLDFFKNRLGVDPASNVVVRALKNGIPTIADFFSERLARTIKREYGTAKVIGGSNCIAHLNDLRDLMEGVVELLADDGVFFVECNYWGGMVQNNNYALIYHDHFSYFSLQNWIDFLKGYGMTVFDATVTPAQGGSLRLFACKDGRAKTERFQDLVQYETDTNLNTYDTCIEYRIAVKREAKNLKGLIKGLKDSGKTIAGYGAAAKGFSVLKLAGIDQTHISYFVDDSPAKQGKYTPVTHIPVISRDKAQEKLPDYFFITAPNYEQVIIEKEKAKGYEGKFITVDCRII